jgi:hypothetical protein
MEAVGNGSDLYYEFIPATCLEVERRNIKTSARYVGMFSETLTGHLPIASLKRLLTDYV